MKTKKFKSPNGEEVHVSLKSGHGWRIGNEWRDVPEFGWRDCFAHGLISEEMVANIVADIPADVSEKLTTDIGRRDEIKAVIKGWLDADAVDNFNKQGFPIVTRVSKEVGYQVQKGLIQEIWHTLQQEMLNDDTAGSS